MITDESFLSLQKRSVAGRRYAVQQCPALVEPLLAAGADPRVGPPTPAHLTAILDGERENWKSLKTIKVKHVKRENCCHMQIFYLLAKIGFDTAENEPAKKLQDKSKIK